jgi:hypothetical protein
MLRQTVKAWIKKATRISGYGDQFVHEANAKIFTFGSYRLGVIRLTASPCLFLFTKKKSWVALNFLLLALNFLFNLLLYRYMVLAQTLIHYVLVQDMQLEM